PTSLQVTALACVNRRDCDDHTARAGARISGVTCKRSLRELQMLNSAVAHAPSSAFLRALSLSTLGADSGPRTVASKNRSPICGMPHSPADDRSPAGRESAVTGS